MSEGRSARNPTIVFWVFLCALMMRVALPGGVMLHERGGSLELVLCSGHGPVQALDATKAPVPQDPGQEHEHHPCPFAGGHVWVPPAEPQALHATEVSWTPSDPPTPVAERGTLRLRAPPPPSRGPPVLPA